MGVLMRGNEFVIEIDNRPGQLARVCELIGQNEINLKAIATDRVGNQTFVRLLVDKDKKMREMLDENDFIYAENEVIIKSISDKPNALTNVARKLGAAGVNIEAIYLLNKGQEKVNLIFSLDNPRKGAELLKH